MNAPMFFPRKDSPQKLGTPRSKVRHHGLRRHGLWFQAVWRLLVVLGSANLSVGLGADEPPTDSRPQPFEIQVIDDQTGRGVPLVIFETVHQVVYVTDNAGRIAYDEPSHVGRTIWFRVKAHGYQTPVDGLGVAGVRFEIEAGGRVELRLKRINLAERLYRVTGEDRYRESLMLGYEVPLRDQDHSSWVAGQDSVQAVVHNDQVFWFWGDTNRLSYVLGLFRTAGATTAVPDQLKLDPTVGMDLDYFVGDDGFARAMIEVPAAEGVVWLDGLAVVPDSQGAERMVGHFSRRKSLTEEVEQGIVVWDEEAERFLIAASRDLSEVWRFPHSHPEQVVENGVSYLQFGNPFLTCRVRADYESVLDPVSYQSWSCIDPKDPTRPAIPSRTAAGALDWQWRSAPPVSQTDEQRWLKEGLIQEHELRFLPFDSANPEKQVLMHSGTVRWNEYRQRWVLIAMEQSRDPKSPSMLGEVWYSEAVSPQGPFVRAVKVLSHDRQSFYNPCHHSFLDREGGRRILFEGTYTNTFTNAPPTPRYDYNQIMYQLDLDQEALREAFPEGR